VIDERFTSEFTASSASFGSQKIAPVGITVDSWAGSEGRNIIFGA